MSQANKMDRLRDWFAAHKNEWTLFLAFAPFAPFAGIFLRLFETVRDFYVASLCVKALQAALIPVFCYKIPA